jgi:AcrR family transcriptional regulator
MSNSAKRPSAHQDRSVATQDLLCDAAEEILREGGLALCTVQEVAIRSGRSPGSVYRRFGDKDGMIEAVLERYLERTLGASDANLRQLIAKCPDLSSRIKGLVDGGVIGQRRDGRLVEAFRDAAAMSSNTRLQEQFNRTRRATFDLVKQRALEGCSSEIAHPDKERAIEFAIAMLVGAIESIMRARTVSISDRTLRTELHAMLLSYLTKGAS